MSFPGSRFLDDVFSKKPFLDGVFSRKPLFVWLLLQEAVCGWCLLREVVFWMMSSPRSCFRKNAFWEIISLKCLEKCLEKSSNSRSKNRGQKSGGQIPAEKGLAKKPSQVLQTIDSKFKTTTPKIGAARGARRPIFGASARGASVVVLKFVSIFCWTLLGFLAGWILCWPMLWDGFFHGFLGDRKNIFEKRPKKHFPNSGQRKNCFFFSEKAS